MKDLNESVRDEIDVILRHAQKALTTGDKQSATKLVEEAWSKLPDPKFGWDVSKSFAHAVAELYRDTGNFSAALKVMNNLFLSGTVKPYQDGPYFILGTIYFELGDLENAKKSLIKAAKISKGRCFNGEPEKYKSII